MPEDARELVTDALCKYAIDGTGEVKRLSGRQSSRLRAGRYRVIFDEDQATILAIYIGKRNNSTCRRH